MRSHVVSGTPPTLSAINADNVDQYFWNGLVSQINDGLTLSQEVMRDFWTGENSCRMAQNPMQAFSQLQQAGTVLCYMKSIPQASSGVSISGGSAADLFTQTETTKRVKVAISNFSGGGDDDEPGSGNVHFIIYGSSSPEGSAGYAFDMYMCNPTASEYQATRVNSATGEYTYTSYNARGPINQSQNQITGSLKEENGAVVFDTSKTRSLQGTYIWQNSQDGGTSIGKNSITVSGDQIVNLYKGSTENSFGEMNYQDNILSQFGGSSLEDVSFIQAGMAMQFSSDGFSNTSYTAAEFQDSYYVPVSEGDYFAAINNYAFDNPFYASVDIDSSLAQRLTSFDCDQGADVTVSVDFLDVAIAAISENCEVDFSDTNFCNGQDVEEARALIMESQIH